MKYLVYCYDKFYKNWRVDCTQYSLSRAKKIVKGLKKNGEKAFYKPSHPDRIAQPVEHLTFNQDVVGSNPTAVIGIVSHLT